MTGKLDPLKLKPLDAPMRPNALTDATAVGSEIAVELGHKRLGPADRLRLLAGWRYSPAAVAHFEAMCREFMRHSKGRWAGEPIEWQPWQLEQWVRPIFGWYRPDGRRGVRRAYIECGKKSGKSTFAAAVALYMALFDGELGAEVYCLASTANQARVVQSQIDQIVQASNDIAIRAQPWKRGREIGWPQTNATISAVSGSGMSGPNSHCLIMDELHEWKKTSGFERWTYSSPARENWLHLAITNAGDDTESICYRQRTYALKVERGEVDDPAFYGRVYSATREEAEAEIESVGDGATRLPIAMKCNPGIGSILKEADLIAEIKQAIHIPSYMPNLMRFWYCVWRTNAATEWLAPHWDDCGSEYSLDDLTGVPCYLGLDLSSVCDMSALVLVTAEEGVHRIWPWFWVPRARAKELRKWTGVETWEKAGHLTVVPGERIDHQMIADHIVHLCSTHDVRAIAYDPKESQLIVNEVEAEAATDVIAFKQSHESYHEPTDNFGADIRAGTIYHPRNAVLTWQAKHALCVETTHGYKKPMKPDQSGSPHKTVDGIQAAVMAYSQAMHDEYLEPGDRIYELV